MKPCCCEPCAGFRIIHGFLERAIPLCASGHRMAAVREGLALTMYDAPVLFDDDLNAIGGPAFAFPFLDEVTFSTSSTPS